MHSNRRNNNALEEHTVVRIFLKTSLPTVVILVREQLFLSREFNKQEATSISPLSTFPHHSNAMLGAPSGNMYGVKYFGTAVFH